MYETILVGTDGSETAGVAVRRAAAIAKAVGARLLILSAYGPVPEHQLSAERRNAPEDVAWAINPREQVDGVLDAAEQSVADTGVAVEKWAVEGSATDAVLDTAAAAGAALIVVGSVGLTGAKRFLLGSVPNRVVHHGTVDVLVVRTA